MPASPPTVPRLDALQQRRQTAAVRFFRDNAQRWTNCARCTLPTARSSGRSPSSSGRRPPVARRGTGTGRLLEVLAPKVEQADRRRPVAARCWHWRAPTSPAPASTMPTSLGDMYALPFEADSFDVVTIHHVLHYADDPAAALSEAARVVRRRRRAGGRFSAA